MAIGFEKHDHSSCISEALNAADTYCDVNGLQLTKTRRRVLEILASQHKAIGAYDILARLNDEGLGSQPPIVYRALDFLVQHGFAHKVEKLNAYSACAHPDKAHSPIFMICKKCDAVVEAQADPSSGSLHIAAQNAGFLIERTVIEVEGLCPSCQDLPSS